MYIQASESHTTADYPWIRSVISKFRWHNSSTLEHSVPLLYWNINRKITIEDEFPKALSGAGLAVRISLIGVYHSATPWLCSENIPSFSIGSNDGLHSFHNDNWGEPMGTSAILRPQNLLDFSLHQAYNSSVATLKGKFITSITPLAFVEDRWHGRSWLPSLQPHKLSSFATPKLLMMPTRVYTLGRAFLVFISRLFLPSGLTIASHHPSNLQYSSTSHSCGR